MYINNKHWQERKKIPCLDVDNNVSVECETEWFSIFVLCLANHWTKLYVCAMCELSTLELHAFVFCIYSLIDANAIAYLCWRLANFCGSFAAGRSRMCTTVCSFELSSFSDGSLSVFYCRRRLNTGERKQHCDDVQLNFNTYDWSMKRHVMLFCMHINCITSSDWTQSSTKVQDK